MVLFWWISKIKKTFYDSLEMVKKFIASANFVFLMEKNGISRLIFFFHYIVLHENIPPSQRLNLKHQNWFGVLVFNYLNISIRAWSSKMKVRTNIFHYLSWLITLDLLNTCIRTFGLWKNCQILFESWNIIMFLYPKLLFVLKILKRVLIKIWYSICYKPVCLSKHINLQNS